MSPNLGAHKSMALAIKHAEECTTVPAYARRKFSSVGAQCGVSVSGMQLWHAVRGRRTLWLICQPRFP